ncbi:MAG TPA: DsbA family protein [Planctomycetes bacterium]|nr:DsbA family protein [Planctomycetota bacterium]HIK61703.1 DsbA family protein [Planctomycetota bacterium]
MNDTLIYVADPMCSWCWGFRTIRDRVLAALSEGTPVRYVMGGLAPDSATPMDDETRGYVRQAWKAVEQATGASFNWEFWSECQPRRSTYPACRAVLLAERLRSGAGPLMFDRIQQAYYQEARNPSDTGTLVALARDLGFDDGAFERELNAPGTQALLEADLAFRRELNVHSFPTLILESGEERVVLTEGYSDAEQVLACLPRGANP